MDAHSTGLIAALAVLIAASAFGLWRRRADGAVRSVANTERLTPADLGNDLGDGLGARLTFVQFSSPVCRPCDATRRILSEAAAASDGVVHVELDAETRLDLVKRFNVLRTPTVLVLDPTGRVAQRISGAPRPPAVHALISASAPAS